MPIRNGARFVVPAVKSILEDEALGTLIIDDGSNDDWETRAAGLLARDNVKIIRQPPAGIATALTPVMAAMVPSPAWMFTGESAAPLRHTEAS